MQEVCIPVLAGLSTRAAAAVRGCQLNAAQLEMRRRLAGLISLAGVSCESFYLMYTYVTGAEETICNVDEVI